uniref:Uncharacterized protein n=1 Tax=Setaria italica TaxID=4555 RepID=K3Z260_SETIT
MIVMLQVWIILYGDSDRLTAHDRAQFSTLMYNEALCWPQI